MLSFALVNLEDHTDVGMVKGRRSLCFTLKATLSLCIFGDIIGQKPESDKTTELYVLGLIDHTQYRRRRVFRQCDSERLSGRSWVAQELREQS